MSGELPTFQPPNAREVITSALMENGFSETQAADQTSQLFDLIEEAAINDLLNEKGLSKADAGKDYQDIADFLGAHFSREEIEAAIIKTAPNFIKRYMTETLGEQFAAENF